MLRNLFLSAIFFSILSSCKVKEVTVTRVEDVKIISLSTTGIEAEISLLVKNPNNFGFKVYDTNLDVKMNNTDIGKAVIDNKIKIKKRSEKVYKVIVKSSFSQVLSGGYSLLMSYTTGKPTDIWVKGETKAGNVFVKKTFPVDVKQKVKLSK